MKNKTKIYLLFIALFFSTVCVTWAIEEFPLDIDTDEDAPVFDKEAAARKKLLFESQGDDVAEGNGGDNGVGSGDSGGGGVEEVAPAQELPESGSADGGAVAERNFDNIWQGRTFGTMFESAQTLQRNIAPTEEKPVVDVIVNIQPAEHFAAVSKELSRLKKIYNAKIGRVVVLGLGTAQKEDKKRKQKELIAKQALKQEDFDYLDDSLAQEKQLVELGLKSKGSIDFETMFGKLTAEVSPTWIIRHQGMDYVYEGINNPSKLFTGKGELKEDFSLKMNVSGDTADDIIVREKVRGVDLYKERPERSGGMGGAVKQPAMWDAVLYE